jgi:kynurenine formamidase
VALAIDLSHEIGHGTVTYPGLPAPAICDFLSREDSRQYYAEGVEFHIARIDMVANTGTYIDSPFHRYRHGKDLAALPLDGLVDLEGLKVRSNSPVIDADAFAGLNVEDRAVLIETGWSRHWGTERYLSGHPFLAAAGARLLKERGAKLVGIDSLNIDDMADRGRPVHSILLGADIPIVEHMTNLAALPETGFRFFAAPVKVREFGTFPVRAFAIVR